ncbi:protein FAM110C-like [Arapaima gigas]
MSISKKQIHHQADRWQTRVCSLTAPYLEDRDSGPRTGSRSGGTPVARVRGEAPRGEAAIVPAGVRRARARADSGSVPPLRTKLPPDGSQGQKRQMCVFTELQEEEPEGRHSMKPLTPIGSPSPLRLLNKGPEYLRRQMDNGGRGHTVSAVERLEADKAKYVKSHQVISTKQEPVLAPCATPPPVPRRPLTVPGASTPHVSPRRTPAAPYSSPGPLSLRDENEDDARKENCLVSVEEHNRSNATRVPSGPVSRTVPLVAPHSAPVVRRSTAKRMLRPDSLVIYRQKKECKTPSTGSNGEVKSYSFVRRLFQGSMREKSGADASPKMVIGEEKAPSRDGDSRMSWSNDKETVEATRETKGSAKAEHTPVLASNSPCMPERTKHTATSVTGDPWLRLSRLHRSKSDLRLRCSLALSEKERFFDYCGLDLEMVERLGPENFLSGASSVDTLSLMLRSVSGGGGGGSEISEFSRHSGEGLFQEELTEQLPSSVSIIERNARVIKWLYSCKNATQEGPKESTV